MTIKAVFRVILKSDSQSSNENLSAVAYHARMSWRSLTEQNKQ